MENLVIVGAGQAGLAMSYELQRAGVAHVVLDAHARIGDNWRTRWKSLRLFSPAEYNNLPGWDFPAPKGHIPAKDEAADYLEAYAARFSLPVRSGVRVTQLQKTGSGFQLSTSEGPLPTQRVVVATGPFNVPAVPALAEALPADIPQMHTRAYRDPGSLASGPVMVVGAGASGSQIAREVAGTGRKTYLAGRDPGSFPRRILGRDIYWWFYRTGVIRMRWDSWLGRRVFKHRDRGDALIGERLKDIVAEAGLIHKPKLTAYAEGGFRFADGSAVDDIESVIWATGYQQKFDWIALDIFGEDGRPRHSRGVVAEAPGLYFIGLKTLYRANSSSMGGVGEDAHYLAGVIAARGQHGRAETLAQSQK
ncbi:MAG: NAD(P)-binding domain-containing protein [Bacteroidota bacterium]